MLPWLENWTVEKVAPREYLHSLVFLVRVMNRRTAVQTVASALAGAVTGCVGSDGNEDEQTTAGKSIRNHPSADNIENQPTLGPSPLESGAVIIAFEDPSCPPCRRFEQDTFPRIREDWTARGEATFVYRGLPIVYDWGQPAVAALEGIYEHEVSAFWSLKEHYYEHQDEFTVDNVRERTKRFVETETDVDAERLVEGLEAGRYEDAVAVDTEAASRAGIESTPTFALFKDGGFLTLIHGAHSFSVFEAALDR